MAPRPVPKSVPNVVRNACTSRVRPRSSRFGMPAALRSRLKILSRPVGTSKTSVIGRKPSRNRLAAPEGFRLECGELVGEPGSKVVRQVGPDDDVVAFPVLLVGGVEFDIGGRPVEPELSDGQGRQLVLAESGQDQRLVDQGSLSADHFEPLPRLRLETWRRLAPSSCPVARSGLRAGVGGGRRRASAPARLRSSTGAGGEGRLSRRPSAPP